MSKEMRFNVSEVLHREAIIYILGKRRAGKMLRSETASFLRDAVRHEIDRYPPSEAQKRMGEQDYEKLAGGGLAVLPGHSTGKKAVGQ